MLHKINFEKILIGISLVCLFLILFSRFQYALQKIFDPDEMSHLHTTYLLTRGILPYRDFLYGHLPFFNFLLFPLFKLLPEGPTVLIFARILMFLINCGSFFLLYKFVRKIGLSAFSAIIAVIFLLVSPFGFERLFEIRPDIPMIFFILLSLNLFLDFLSNIETSSFQNRFHANRLNNKFLFLSGLSLSIANAFLLRALPAIGILLIISFLALIARYRNLKKVIISTGLFVLGITLPFLILIIYWSITGTLSVALKYMFNYGPQVLIPYGISYGPWVYLGIIPDNYSYYETGLFNLFYQQDVLWLALNQVIWLTALIILIKHLLTFFLLKTKLFSRLLSLLLISLTVSYIYIIYLFVIYLPQYWLMAVVLISILAAEGTFFIKKLLDKILPLAGFLFGITVIVLTSAIFIIHSQVNLPHFGYNERQLNVISYVLANTKKTDRLYDGIGAYVFRPDCSINAMTSPQEIPKSIFRYLIDEIEASHCTAIIPGLYNRVSAWGTGEQDYIKENYAPSENPDVWFLQKTIRLNPLEAKNIKIIKEGYYISSTINNLSVDDQKIAESVFLNSGLHKITNTEILPVNVILKYDLGKNK